MKIMNTIYVVWDEETVIVDGIERYTTSGCIGRYITRDEAKYSMMKYLYFECNNVTFIKRNKNKIVFREKPLEELEIEHKYTIIKRDSIPRKIFETYK